MEAIMKKVLLAILLLSVAVSSCSHAPKPSVYERFPANEVKAFEVVKGDSLLFCSIPKDQDTSLELTFVVNTTSKKQKAWFVQDKDFVKGVPMEVSDFQTMRCRECYKFTGKLEISEDQVFGFEADISGLSGKIGGTAIYQGSMVVPLACERIKRD
jgi:hypothetical protein